MTTLAGYTYLRNTKGQVLVSPSTGLPLVNSNFTKIGDRQPDFNLGIINKFKYKNVSLSVALDIRKGGDIFNGNALYLWILGLHPNQANREKQIVVQGVLRDGKEETGRADGTLRGYGLVTRDMTERQQANEALKLNAEKFRSLVNHIPDAVWTVNAAGAALFMSGNAERIYGFTR